MQTGTKRDGRAAPREGRLALDGVGHGSVLAGRYRLEDRQQSGPDGSLWRATDETLERQVSVRVLRPGHPFAADVVDAARRAALVDDPRLARVLDVGDSDGKTYIVSEHVQGRALGDLLSIGPLPAETVRRIAGEAAQALERAGARGLHHLRLNPSSVIVQPDGSIKLVGTAVEAAVAGAEPDNAVAASRSDAIGLVSIIYAGLTGRWPGSPGMSDGPLGPAPRVTGRAVPPGELVAGVPNDLDTLCSVTLGPNDDGPHSPGELAEQLSPWAQPQPLTDPGGLILSAPSRPIPITTAAAGSPAGPGTGTGASSGSGTGEDAYDPEFDEVTVAYDPRSRSAAPQQVDLRTPRPGQSRSPVDTPPSISLPATPGSAIPMNPAGMNPAPASQPAAAAGAAPATANAATSAASATAAPTTSAPASAAPTTAAPAPVAPTRAAPAAASAASPPASSTPDWASGAGPSGPGANGAGAGANGSAPYPAAARSTDWPASRPAAAQPVAEWQPVVRAAGFPPPPSPGRGVTAGGAPRVSDLEHGGQAWPTPAPAARATTVTPDPTQGGYAQHYNDLASEILGDPGARGVRRLEPAPAPQLGQASTAPWTDQWGQLGTAPPRGLTPAPAGPGNPRQAQIVIAVLVGLVVLGLFLAGLGLRGLFSSGTTSTTLPSPSAAAPSTVKSSEKGTTPAPSSASVGSGAKVQVVSAQALDPQGDHSENNANAPKVIDGDATTFWQSEYYTSQVFAGTNKSGVGLLLDLGRSTAVSSVTIDYRGAGGTVELRTNADPAFEGSTVAATGAMDGTKLVITPTSPLNTRYLVLWFTKLTHQSTGENKLIINEVSVR